MFANPIPFHLSIFTHDDLPCCLALLAALEQQENKPFLSTMLLLRLLDDARNEVVLMDVFGAVVGLAVCVHGRLLVLGIAPDWQGYDLGGAFVQELRRRGKLHFGNFVTDELYIDPCLLLVGDGKANDQTPAGLAVGEGG